jgi:microcystin-dependent protein
MSDWYLGEIRAVSFNFAPRGWLLCNGQTLSIAQNQALFALLGVQFGGNGTTTFNLPDLRGRASVNWGQSSTGTTYTEGEMSGSQNVTMTSQQLPIHTHFVSASTASATLPDPTGSIWAAGADSSGTPVLAFTESRPNAVMDNSALAPTGGNSPIPIMQPYLVLNYIIATTGIFPSRQ